MPVTPIFSLKTNNCLDQAIVPVCITTMNSSPATSFLVEQMISQGIPEDQAQQVTDRCLKAILLSGVGGYFVGQLAGPTLMAIFVNPPAAVALLGIGGAVAVASMAYQAGFSNSCSDVRKAVFNWNTGSWNQSSLR